MRKSIVASALGLLIGLGCAKPNPGPPLAERKPSPLLDVEALPAAYREGARAVAASLTGEGEKPEEFYCEVEDKEEGRIQVFHLWHESAFLPENRGMAGNPGGKCRDVWYDTRQRKVVETLGWQ